jgi:hypothetical protein
VKNGDIKDGLDTCERELDTAMNLFQVYLLNDLFYSELTGSITARSSTPLSPLLDRYVWIIITAQV